MALLRKEAEDRRDALRAEAKALHALATRLARAGLETPAGPVRAAASYAQSAANAIDTVTSLVPENMEAP